MASLDVSSRVIVVKKCGQHSEGSESGKTRPGCPRLLLLFSSRLSLLTSYLNKMAGQQLKAAILVVSDTASQDPSSDKVVGTLNDVFAAAGANNWDQPITKIVPDDILQIQRTVCEWTDGSDVVNLILISGGTGFAVKDNTPEAVTPLLHRQAPGLVYVH